MLKAVLLGGAILTLGACGGGGDAEDTLPSAQHIATYDRADEHSLPLVDWIDAMHADGKAVRCARCAKFWPARS